MNDNLPYYVTANYFTTNITALSIVKIDTEESAKIKLQLNIDIPIVAVSAIFNFHYI